MKRVLFASSDPGGANVIAALIRRLPPEGQFRLITDPDGYRVRGLEDRYEIARDPGDIAAVFEDAQPEVVITATSNEATVEVDVLREARQRGVRAAAIIDHWTNFARRFKRLGRPTIFPDTIFVPDDAALYAAVADGLPPERLRVLGHPHFHDAFGHRPSASRAEFWKSVGVPPNRKVVLFVSDALTESAGGTARAEAEFGYTELQILEAIINALPGDVQLSLVIKAHPRERLAKFEPFKTRPRTYVLGDAPFWDVLAHSDYVIGMFSSALIEAAALGKLPLRVEINARADLLPVPSSMYFERVTQAGRVRSALETYIRSAPPPVVRPFAEALFEEILRLWLT